MEFLQMINLHKHIRGLPSLFQMCCGDDGHVYKERNQEQPPISVVSQQRSPLTQLQQLFDQRGTAVPTSPTNSVAPQAILFISYIFQR